jgi:hypothetical protein
MPGDLGFFSSLSVMCGTSELIDWCVSFRCVVRFIKGRNSTKWVVTVLVGPGLD